MAKLAVGIEVPGQTCLWAFLRDNTAIKVWGVCCVQGAVSEEVGEHITLIIHYHYFMMYMLSDMITLHTSCTATEAGVQG